MIARRNPEVPSRNTTTVPGSVLIWAPVAPEIAMPAEPKYGLPAHTTMAGALRIGRFAKWGWWYPKTHQWP
jgi:hypothetical protein